MGENKERLTSSEITNLWTHYIREVMAVCVSKYALTHIEDKNISSTFKFAFELSNQHLQKLKELFTKENFPIPNGFTNDDVNLSAPPLFTEKFWLEYIHDMTMHGLSSYSISFSSSTRKDIRDFYYKCMTDSMDLYNDSIEMLLSKGLYEHPPYYSTPEQVSYIDNLSYVTDVFGVKRPLNSIESGNIFFNLKKTILAKVIILGFGQVCKDKDVQKFFENGLKVVNKHISIYSSLLLQDNLKIPSLLDSEITNSTVAPFSDKLMLYHVGFLFAAAASYYGIAAVASMRADIPTHCETSIMRDLKGLAKFGQLMIKHKWLEEPPKADDRKIND